MRLDESVPAPIGVLEDPHSGRGVAPLYGVRPIPPLDLPPKRISIDCPVMGLQMIVSDGTKQRFK